MANQLFKCNVVCLTIYKFIGLTKKVGEGEKEMEKRLSWIIASSIIAGGQIIPFEVEKSSSRSRSIFIPQR